MAIQLEVPLFLKPGDHLDEGQPVTPQQLRELADGLHELLTTAAKTVEILEGQGWGNQMSLYSISLEPDTQFATVAEAEAALQRLGVHPEAVAIFDDEEEDDLVEADSKA